MTPFGTKLITKDGETVEVPGDILQLWANLRTAVGVVKKKKKQGVKFDVLEATEVVDKVRAAANELGILIYPAVGTDFATTGSLGKGHVVEDGTLAEASLVVVAQAVSDGSRLCFWGFGLGADTQDKAGGKAGTYAFKQALVQALLAGGKGGVKVDDTDDTDTPIPGGVKPAKAKAARPSFDEVQLHLQMALDSKDPDAYRAARTELRQLKPEDILALKELAKQAKTACGVTD